jgi:hypothetical protein
LQTYRDARLPASSQPISVELWNASRTRDSQAVLFLFLDNDSRDHAAHYQWLTVVTLVRVRQPHHQGKTTEVITAHILIVDVVDLVENYHERDW